LFIKKFFSKKNKGSKKQKPKPWKVILRTLFATGAFCLALLFVCNMIVVGSAKKYILSASEVSDEDFDCILVLGCLVWSNGKMSWMLKDRVDTGIGLYKQGASPKLLMSGDHGREDYDEVNTMKTYAIGQGVPSEDIFMDHAGFSTYESMYRAKNVFAAKKILVVTQNFHLSRAVYDARAMGLDAYGVNADHYVYNKMWKNELRESLARTKDIFYCIFKPQSTYMGDKIDLTGSGDITNDE